MNSFKYCLTTRQTVWFFDDVAPTHFRREVRQVLDSHHIDRSMW